MILIAACGGLTVCQQDRIFVACVNVLCRSHQAQIVACQHQASFQVGAATGSQSVDSILDSLETFSRPNVLPFADPLCILRAGTAKANHRNPNCAASGIADQQLIQEAALARDGCLGGIQARGATLARVFLTMALFSTDRAEIHRARGINDQLHRRVTGGDGLGGLHRQGDVKGVLTGLLNGLAEGEALAIGHAGVGRTAIGSKPPRHDLILKGSLAFVHGECRDLHQAQAHYQGHEQAQCPLADGLAPGDSLARIVLCHDSFPPSIFNRN
ncbi:MAG: hypothetical protein SO100_03455 [Dysosmobacter sp.]|nr:hypothetical protein [Dysosmobacter sp.]